MSLQGLMSVLPPPRRGEPSGFIGNPQETFDRRAGWRRATDAFENHRANRAPRQDAPSGDPRRRIGDRHDPQTRPGGRRIGDSAASGGLHLKLPTAPEYVRHSSPFVAQAIGQERGTIMPPPRGTATGTAAYDAVSARIDSFFSVIEPISVYA
ncbi:MAG: hypothetical protein RID42_01800 [Alphaproteobacteria bacterium]